MDSPFNTLDLDKVREPWPECVSVCVCVLVESRYTIGHSIMPHPEDTHVKRGRDSGYQSVATQADGGWGRVGGGQEEKKPQFGDYELISSAL